jgi:hypothetical protein
MNTEISSKESLLYRILLALFVIFLAGALRFAPHPQNLTPIGAIALFSGAIIRDRRIAFVFPLLAFFARDLFIGYHKLTLLVCASFLINVALGLLLRDRRTVGRVSLATLAGSIQFFLVTNFGVWLLLGTYPRTYSGLVSCYVAGLPLFRNTLAGDAFYSVLLFGGYALAERMFPALRPSVQPAASRSSSLTENRPLTAENPPML